ncbi:glutathione S-transferase [Novosphingobium sp. 1949]|uniref:Glutathione S-transferase n=1 Tax=Novosphingobium organovorum TaxID=2930092 RepID=A0ABT0B8W8_9SPHN|nr:glutathione S-transferase [Novosphingobium organovorum]MCJ2181520.1 glutathione S-transferase [Novosphingobium organovorum]
MSADLPVLYSFRRCPYAMRARLAVKVAGLACALREVKLAAKPAAMLDASPKGTVPVLVLRDGTVIAQSLDVMRHALARHDPEGWLERDDAALVARNDGAFKHHLDRYKYPERHASDPLEHRAAGCAILADLDARVAANGQLCGPTRGLADMAIVPFVRQFAATDRAWFDAQDLPALRRWLDGHLASELFASVMDKYAPWQPGDATVRFG